METNIVRKVLNVGGSNKRIALPPWYSGWEHILLDIDPRHNPDVVCDARELITRPAAEYDSVYCSHNLEHYYRHDVAKVLAGFFHVLKPDGFVLIRVPDMGKVMETVVQKGLDINDALYESPMGPITVRDIIYGHSWEIESSGSDFYAHKTGFTSKSLTAVLIAAGFAKVSIATADPFEIWAIALLDRPTEYVTTLLGLPREG